MIEASQPSSGISFQISNDSTKTISLYYLTAQFSAQENNIKNELYIFSFEKA